MATYNIPEMDKFLRDLTFASVGPLNDFLKQLSQGPDMKKQNPFGTAPTEEVIDLQFEEIPPDTPEIASK